MCGIAGFFRSEGAALKPEFLKPMCDRLAHRGPDGYGQFVDTDVALGNRRLSIIDVEGGGQPLGNEDGSIQVVFNGEIYNYKELRRSLESRGHLLRTAGDSEVLVHLYEDYGERMPEVLNGMFAFAIWDRRSRKLFMARDRFGEKPLYFSTELPGLRACFASELKALMLLPGFVRTVRRESVPEFLSHGYIADPATIYKQVQRVSPGESVSIDWSETRFRRYWTPVFDLHSGRSFSAASNELSHLAMDAVKCRLMSEVPLGAFLSGGLDSSAIVASMSESAGGAVSTFSIGFTSGEFDETHYARLVADRYLTLHREFIVSTDIAEMLELCLDHFDEPFGDASAIATLYLARMARKEVVVALSGDGADELFGGYPRYRQTLSACLRSLLPSRYAAATEWSFDHLPTLFTTSIARRRLAATVADNYFRWTSAIEPERLQNLLSTDLIAALRGYEPVHAMAERFERHRELPLLDQMLVIDMETYLPGDILVKMDRATMAFSLEARAPWLDHRLAEFAGTLPQSFKMKGGIGKRIVRRAFSSQLPASTLTRSKMGFGVPLADWLRTSLKRMFEEYVLRPDMSEYLHLPAVEELWQEHQSGANDHRIWVLWNIFMLARWHDRYQCSSLA